MPMLSVLGGMGQSHIDLEHISRVPHRRTKNMPHSSVGYNYLFWL